MKLSRYLLPLAVGYCTLLLSDISAHDADGEYDVDVRPYERERRAIPITGTERYNAHLTIHPDPDCGWVLADSRIIDQDSTLWTGPEPKTPNEHVYHLCDAFSSQEYVFIKGSLTREGVGTGGGRAVNPPFWVTVPSVDLDWTGFGTDMQGGERYTDEKYEEVEGTNAVAISTSTDPALCSKIVINQPRDDGALVSPKITLSWTYPALLKLYDINWREISSGTTFDSVKLIWPKTFYTIAYSDASEHLVDIILEGEADEPYQGKGPSRRAIDKIRGLIPKIAVDLDVDSDYDGSIDEPDDPIEESSGGLVCIRSTENPRLTPIRLSLSAGTAVNDLVRLMVESGGNKIRIWDSAAMENEVDLSKPIDLGTEGKAKILYVQGVEASEDVRDVALWLLYSKAGGSYICEDKIKLTVVKPDLDVDANYDGSISDTDDPLEVSAGGFTATNVLRRINLAVFPGPNKLTSGGLVLSAVAGGDKIKVWADQNKTTEVPLDKAWNVTTFPDKLYVEGIKASDTVRDIQLRLCYTNRTFSCCDEIKLTSVAVDINGDYNRNGNPVDDVHEADAVSFDGLKGMVILANTDDDVDDQTKQPDCEDNVINGANDLADICTLKLAKLGIYAEDIPVEMTLELSVESPSNDLSGAPAAKNRARIFCSKDRDAQGVVGPDPLTDKVVFKKSPGSSDIDIELIGGTGDLEMGIEGIEYGREVIVKLLLKLNGQELCNDSIRLLVSPFLVLANTDKATMAYVANAYGWQDFYDETAVALNGVVTVVEYSADFTQDYAEIGATRSALGQSVRKLCTIAGFFGTRYADQVASDTGFFNIEAGNPGGNVEASPPIQGYPYGRLIVGSSLQNNVEVFLKAQKVQTDVGNLIELPVSWLQVKHVDEVMSIIPVGSGFKVLVADLDLAIDLLRNNPNEETWGGFDTRTQLLAAYDNPNNAAKITLINNYLTSIRSALVQGLGIDTSDLIKVPVAFEMDQEGSIGTKLPDMVNLIVVVPQSGSLNLVVPRPYFAPFATTLGASLTSAGCSGTMTFVDTTGPHSAGGEAHCASNVRRSLP